MAETAVQLAMNLKRRVDDFVRRLEALEKPLEINEKRLRIEDLDALMQSPDFWNDQTTASRVQRERNETANVVDRFERTHRQIRDLVELLELAGEDEATLHDIQAESDIVDNVVRQMEMARMFRGQHDKNNTIVTINVGQGGVDAQDFVEMLLRMYTRYAERRGWEVELMDLQPGEEAGYKSATALIKGEYAHGFLKAEIGVHRLVRISPFDANARRQTSFASVWALPEIDDDINIEIKDVDLRVDTLRSGGAGGQHVNKTESAIRLTHLPTNTVVLCQQERSQIKNRALAMKLLKAKLYDLEVKQRLAEKDKAEAAKMEASFGSQIRNYVLAPYKLVKDLRSGFEASNVDGVLDGDLQECLEAYLLFESSQADEAKTA